MLQKIVIIMERFLAPVAIIALSVIIFCMSHKIKELEKRNLELRHEGLDLALKHLFWVEKYRIENNIDETWTYITVKDNEFKTKQPYIGPIPNIYIQNQINETENKILSE